MPLPTITHNLLTIIIRKPPCARAAADVAAVVRHLSCAVAQMKDGPEQALRSRATHYLLLLQCKSIHCAQANNAGLLAVCFASSTKSRSSRLVPRTARSHQFVSGRRLRDRSTGDRFGRRAA